MKKILFFLFLLPTICLAQTQLELPYSIKVLNPKPLDAYYYNQSGTMYTNTAEVLSEINAAVRYVGQTVIVSPGVEYWFEQGTDDVDLTIKLNTSSFVTGTSGTDFNISTVGTTYTFNIPDASAANRGLVTTGAQIFAGDKVFNGGIGVGGITPLFPLHVQGAEPRLMLFDNTAVISATNPAWAIRARDVGDLLFESTEDNSVFTTRFSVDRNGVLNIPTVPTNDDAETQLLVRDSGTGNVEYRDVASITGGGGSGITSLNALTGSAQIFATGTTGTDFNISSSGTTHTFNIPSASAAARGLVSTGIQAFEGNKTFNANVGIGTSSQNAPLQFSNTMQSRKIVLYEFANNDNQVTGIGTINQNSADGHLRYQLAGTTLDHIFYVGLTSTTSKELFRIAGDGVISIGTTPTTDNTNSSVLTRDSGGNIEVKTDLLDGSGSNTRVAVFTDANTLAGYSDFTFSSGSNTLSVDNVNLSASTYSGGILGAENIKKAGQLLIGTDGMHINMSSAFTGGHDGDFRLNATDFFVDITGELMEPYFSTSLGLDFRRENATTNTVIDVAQLTRSSTGTPATGIGAALPFYVETSSANNERGAVLEVATMDATATSEDFSFTVKLMEAGATATEKFKIESDGDIKITDVPTINNANATLLSRNSSTGIIELTQVDAIAPVDYGNYTPTIGSMTNVSSFSVGDWQWSRIGTTVHVSGKLGFSITANNTWSTFTVSLPTSADFSGDGGLSGTAVYSQQHIGSGSERYPASVSVGASVAVVSFVSPTGLAGGLAEDIEIHFIYSGYVAP